VFTNKGCNQFIVILRAIEPDRKDKGLPRYGHGFLPWVECNTTGLVPADKLGLLALCDHPGTGRTQAPEQNARYRNAGVYAARRRRCLLASSLQVDIVIGSEPEYPVRPA